MTLTLTLLAPLGLAALVALAVPIVIHLVRRIELRTTEFAALRWISERIRPRRRLRFERPWLLLLRLALLALLALLLARPIVSEPTIAKPAWVVVAPGSDIGAARGAVSIEGADWRWLAPGFPAIETPAPSKEVPVASLLREIDAELPRDAKLAVVVPEQVSGLDGERALLSRAVDWHVVAGRAPSSAVAASNESTTLAVRYAPSAERSLKYLRAAVTALDAHGGDHYTLDAESQDVALHDGTRLLIWLGADPTPAIRDWIEAGGTAITDHAPRASGAPVWSDAEGNVLARAEPLGRGRLVALSAALSPQTLPELLDAEFPERLSDLLRGAPPAPTAAPASAMRPAQSTGVDAAASIPSAAKPLDPWLALLIAALVLIERVVATRPRASA
ncbi:MAG TPA: BatA domain-containing protein [Rhodanobacteraceae bacterium]|nr:BatA domain-containing protein [Rhodanobacteraceae bacterium]